MPRKTGIAGDQRIGPSDMARTVCDLYQKAEAAGEDTTPVIGQLATMFGVQRPAIFKTLRRWGVLPPYGTAEPGKKGPRPKDDKERRAKMDAYKSRKVESLPPRVYRDPCWRCGTRADYGCHHLEGVL